MVSEVLLVERKKRKKKKNSHFFLERERERDREREMEGGREGGISKEVDISLASYT